LLAANYNRLLSGTSLQFSEPLALLLIAIAVALAVALPGIAAYRRQAAARRPRPVTTKKRLDAVIRDLDRIAESLGEVAKSETTAWQSFHHGLAALGECRWEDAIGHIRAAEGLVAGVQLAPLLHQTGVCLYMQGRLDDALREFREAARLSEQREDKVGRALALNNIGVISHDCGELDDALRDLQLARILARESGDRMAEAICLASTGNVLRDKGEYSAALKSEEAALAMARGVGDRTGVASCQGNIASVLRDKGELDEAIERYTEALEACRKVGYKFGAVIALSNIGGLYRAKGDLKRAQESHESALALAHQIADRLGIAAELVNIGLILVARWAHEQAVTYLAEPLTLFLAAGAAEGPRQALYGLSKCDDALGREQMQGLLRRAGLAADAIADACDRIDQIRSRRPWQKGIQRNPFAPTAALSPSPAT
jgi:tetratricopeptide (TPR) repeat protein